MMEGIILEMAIEKNTLSILIVDDDESIRELFERLLKREGYFIDAVEDGAGAIEKTKAKNYDIAFIDIVMPGINGYLTFCEIKKISPNIKAVMMTGYSEESTIKAAIKEGAYACLFKPFSRDNLFSLIKKIGKKLI